MARVIKIDGIEFEEKPGCDYLFDYYGLVDDIIAGKKKMFPTYMSLIQQDLFFICHFIFRMPNANCPFWVKACRDVQEGPRDNTLDLWARDHGKSTIITKAMTLQDILKNPEERVGVFSYTKSAALDFIRPIKLILEQHELVRTVFHHVCWERPATQAPTWSEEFGYTVKREGFFSEATLEGCGLLEAMPTRKHFTLRVYDDIVTRDIVRSPDLMQKIEENFYLSENLGTEGGRKRIVGTIYHHSDLLSKLRGRKYPDGTPQYTVRIKTTTDDGTPNGRPVFISEKRNRELLQDLDSYYPQQLLNPTPAGTQQLPKGCMRVVPANGAPKTLWKFMALDAAGDKASKRNDRWAFMVGGFEPRLDADGLANLYILDLVIRRMDFDEAIAEVVKMYLRNGYVRRFGIEKVGMSSTEIHVSNAVRAKGRTLTEEAGNLQILRPAGRSKTERILGAVKRPLLSGKIHILSSVDAEMRGELESEMDSFPKWHDDGLDVLAYLYDLVKTDYMLIPEREASKEEKEAEEEDYSEGDARSETRWMRR